MKIKKYRAADSQQAMRLIRAEQGPDASILTCYQVPEGIEFVVAINTPDLQDASGRQLSVRARESQKNDETAADRDLMTLRHELGSMRVLLERNLGRLVAQESPLATGDLAARLTSAGLGGVLQQRLRTVLPEQPDRETLAEAIKTSLGAVTRGEWPAHGATALIGSPGAGKTQLMITLALQHRRRSPQTPLFLVSLDRLRFGAREQLMALGKVLRLPVLFAEDAAALRDELAQLPADARVLVDTAGADHHDEAALAALGKSLDAAGVAHRVLVMAMDMSEELRQLTLSAFAALRPSGVVTTRVDTLAQPGLLASWLCRQDLPWLGSSISRDHAAAWQAADTGALAARIAVRWPLAAAVPVPEHVERWSWSAQRRTA